MDAISDSVSRASVPSPVPHATPHRRIWPWLCVLLVLVAFAATIAVLRPASGFGTLQDDAMYFASAKALAAGQGYFLPSFPGHLKALKYPELYPWLLSWVWRMDSSFPGNVVWAITMSVFFACWFLVTCFLLARRTFGLGTGWALAVTALCGFNFFTLLLGGSVLSDLPFAALALSAALAADRAIEGDGRWGWMALAGVLASLSVGLRTVGVMVVAGIALVAVLRRAWRQAAVICVVGGGLSLPWVLPVLLRAIERHASPASTANLPLGWTQTLAFYTSYIGQWRHFVPNWATQRAVLTKNAFSILLEPGIFLLFPVANRSALLSAGLGSVVAIAAWAGIVWRFRRTGWKTIDAIFLFYLAMILPWPFPPQRFLVPFLPLFFAGLIFVFRELATNLASRARHTQVPVNRTAIVGAGVALLAVAGLAAANGVWFAPRLLSRLAAGRRSQLAEMRQAYRWIDSHSGQGARFIAYDDVLLYLYTNRQAIRPIVCSTAAAYDNDPAYARRDAAHLGDVARHVGANYWLASPEDFDREVGDDRVILTRAEKNFLADFPVVFQSDSGRVRIYALRPAGNSATQSGVQ